MLTMTAVGLRPQMESSVLDFGIPGLLRSTQQSLNDIPNIDRCSRRVINSVGVCQRPAALRFGLRDGSHLSRLVVVTADDGGRI